MPIYSPGVCFTRSTHKRENFKGFRCRQKSYIKLDLQEMVDDGADGFIQFMTGPRRKVHNSEPSVCTSNTNFLTTETYLVRI